MGTTAAKLQYALDSKNAVREALQEKDLDVTSDIGTYADLIRENLANTSDATATAEDIMAGETAYVKGEKITGTATGGIPIVTTAGSGSAYTATVDKVTALTVGMKITIIPHVVSASTDPTLNVNGLGAKTIRQRLSTNTSLTSVGPSASWLVAGKPVTVMYNGTYWVAELTRADANNLYGTVPITSGGTGASTLAAAQSNLGITAMQTDIDTLRDDLDACVTAYEEGCNTIVNGCTTYGSTPEGNSPEQIVESIKTIYNDRYSAGITAARVWSTKEIGVSSVSDSNNYFTCTFKTNVTGKTLYENLFFYVSLHNGHGGGTENVISSASYNSTTGVLTVVGWCSEAARIKIWYNEA